MKNICLICQKTLSFSTYDDYGVITGHCEGEVEICCADHQSNDRINAVCNECCKEHGIFMD